MLTLTRIRSEIDAIKLALSKRNLSDEQMASLDTLIELDDKRKSTQTDMDEQLSQINKISKEIGELFKSGQQQEAIAAKSKVAEIKEQAKDYEQKLKDIKDEMESILLTIPNVPNESVPVGHTDEDNEEFKAWDQDLPALSDEALPHWELAKKYNLIDFERGVKITGAGFPVYRGKAAKMQRALIQFFLDTAGEAGYEELNVPFVVNYESGKGTGNLPDKEGQMYHVTKDDFYMIPTAEVPVTNFHRAEILQESDLPIKYTAFSPCFRREAGSYGADVKGLNRLHQFEKVEIVQFALPDQSYGILDEMVSYVEGILKKLELPYRILRLCGGDLTFASSLTFDFEVYSAAQKRWLEVSSVSNFETFQSNRMKIRYKNSDGKSQLVHTLNGSALALPRIMASIMENYQKPEGIRVPEAIQKYTGFDIIN